MEDDLDIENILEAKPKKIKSGKKGKRVELELVKDLNSRFSEILSRNPDIGKFSRSVGSEKESLLSFVNQPYGEFI